MIVEIRITEIVEQMLLTLKSSRSETEELKYAVITNGHDKSGAYVAHEAQ